MTPPRLTTTEIMRIRTLKRVMIERRSLVSNRNKVKAKNQGKIGMFSRKIDSLMLFITNTSL